jgi:hypothetical protein
VGRIVRGIRRPRMAQRAPAWPAAAPKQSLGLRRIADGRRSKFLRQSQKRGQSGVPEFWSLPSPRTRTVALLCFRGAPANVYSARVQASRRRMSEHGGTRAQSTSGGHSQGHGTHLDETCVGSRADPETASATTAAHRLQFSSASRFTAGATPVSPFSLSRLKSE